MSSRHVGSSRLRCVLLNAARLDHDGSLDFTKLKDVADVTRYEISDPSDVAYRVSGHHVVLNKEMALTGDIIRSFPDSVKLIAEAGTGYNNIDLVAAKEKGISVSNVPCYATEAMAHQTVTMVMALSCSLAQQVAALAVGNRQYMKQCHLGNLPHFELTGTTIGLVGGLGTIGKRVAAMTSALGMRVIASSTSQPPGMRQEDGIEVVTFDSLLSQSDFVSIHCPLNEHTKNLIDERALAQMKSTAYLINTARGAIIDQDALVKTLSNRHIAGAALDVFGEGSAPPPALPDDSPLWKLNNVVLTPHIGWQRSESRQRVVDTLAENIAAFSRGEPSNIDIETGRPRKC